MDRLIEIYIRMFKNMDRNIQSIVIIPVIIRISHRRLTHRVLHILNKIRNKRIHLNSIEIEILPGSKFASILKLFFSKRVREKIFDQMLEDSYDEYIEVLNRKGSNFELWMVKVRINLDLFIAAVAQPLESILRKLKEIWKIY